MKKKGVSEVVTAILLVLLAVAAVIIVWGVVRGFITTTAGGATGGCTSIELSITGVNTTANSVIVKREVNIAGETTLAKIKFVFENSTGSIVTEKTSALKELESQTFTFASGEYAVGYNKVSAYPKVSAEGGEQLCSKSASWTA